MMNKISLAVFVLLGATIVRRPANGPIEPPKKANDRTPRAAANAAEPFDGASVEKMASQCVTLETELGAIEIAFMPEVAPEAVRNFLNLVGYRGVRYHDVQSHREGFCYSGRQSSDE